MRPRVGKKTCSGAACFRNRTAQGVFAHTPGARLGEGEPTERPDFSAHPASGGGGRRLWAGDTSPSRKFQDDVAHIPRGCCRHRSRSWPAAGRPRVGRGDPDDPGRGRGRLLSPWTRQGKPEPFGGARLAGEGARSFETNRSECVQAPFPPILCQSFSCGSGKAGVVGGLCSGECGLPGCGRDWSIFCSSPFQSSTPAVEPSLGTQQERRLDSSRAYLRRMRDCPCVPPPIFRDHSAHSMREQGQR